MKLSKIQERILKQMKKGWSLERVTGVNERWWLEKNLECQDIPLRTAKSLLKKGLIDVEEYRFITTKWKLTEKAFELIS